MKKQHYIGILVSILLLSLGSAVAVISAQPVRAETASLSTARLPESTDFATVSFGDAWDMSQFTDVSQYINGAGRNPSLTSILVQDGVFSATSTVSTTDPDAFIFPLFPGYPNVMQLGNWGSITPIIPSQYHCLYIAMKVNSTATNDSYRVLWYPDQNLVVPSTTSNSGSVFPVNLYPEWGTSRYWKLHMIDLSAPPSGYIGKPWTSYSPWLGLELIMTHYDNISLAIDWIRLTPCHSDPKYRTTVTWTPSASVTALWVRPQGTTRDIRLTKGLNGLSGSYSLDTQGLAPGVYSVGLGDDTTCCSQWSVDQLEINTSPILDFDRPSPTSGVDYSTTAGDAWDMNAANDIDAIQCASWSFANNLLLLDTEYPSLIDEPGCLGPEVGEADPKVYLNMPGLLESGKDYRYLSFRLYQNGAISIPADGMIVRWIWTDLSNCIRVSQMVALEVGWNEYNIDLYHPFNGLPVASAYCSVNPLQPWREVGGIKTLRFDPNENWTGKILPAMIFHQEIDWIRLSKVDGVWQGSIFPIEVTLNKAPSTVQYIDFYYTSNRSQPQQYYIGRMTPGLSVAEVAEVETLPGINAPLVNQFHYLPFLVRNISAYPPLLPNQVRYLWNTNSVVPGEYYICGQAYDGLNLNTFCSKAPLQIRTP